MGINTFISEERTRSAFALPINAAKAVLRDLRETGRVARPWLGLQGREIDAQIASLFRLPLARATSSRSCNEGSPAERAGVRGGTMSVVVQGEEYLVGGDILTAIEGTPIKTHQEYLAK